MFNHRARRADAGAYWSDLRNHVRFEPGVERIELDGPTGPTGRTVAARLATELDRLAGDGGGVPYSGQTSTAGSDVYPG